MKLNYCLFPELCLYLMVTLLLNFSVCVRCPVYQCSCRRCHHCFCHHQWCQWSNVFITNIWWVNLYFKLSKWVITMTVVSTAVKSLWFQGHWWNMYQKLAFCKCIRFLLQVLMFQIFLDYQIIQMYEYNTSCKLACK